MKMRNERLGSQTVTETSPAPTSQARQRLSCPPRVRGRGPSIRMLAAPLTEAQCARYLQGQAEAYARALGCHAVVTDASKLAAMAACRVLGLRHVYGATTPGLAELFERVGFRFTREGAVLVTERETRDFAGARSPYRPIIARWIARLPEADAPSHDGSTLRVTS